MPSWLDSRYLTRGSTGPPEPDHENHQTLKHREQFRVGTWTSTSCDTHSIQSSKRELKSQLTRFVFRFTLVNIGPQGLGLRKHAILPLLRNPRMQLRGSSRPGR